MNNTDNDLKKGPASAGPVFDLIAFVVSCIAGAGLIALVLLISSEIAIRLFANSSLLIVAELAGYLVILLTFLGASLALRNNALFQVGFIFQKLTPKLQRWLSFFFIALSLGVSSVLFWQSCQLVLSSFSRGNVAPTTLMTPLWVPQMVIPFGLFFIMIFVIEHGIICMRSGDE